MSTFTIAARCCQQQRAVIVKYDRPRMNDLTFSGLKSRAVTVQSSTQANMTLARLAPDPPLCGRKIRRVLPESRKMGCRNLPHPWDVMMPDSLPTLICDPDGAAHGRRLVHRIFPVKGYAVQERVAEG